jgi:segregation and condensation protein B
MQFTSQLESILFVASKPLTFNALAKALGTEVPVIADAVQVLVEKCNIPTSGIHIIVSDDTVQMATNSDNAKYIESFVKDEIAGELTKAQLETFTVIAYMGPITRPEIEEIRGVNCSVILRTLMVRGLIDEKEVADKVLPAYTITTEAMRHLGITSPRELSQYESLHSHAHLTGAVIDDAE